MKSLLFVFTMCVGLAAQAQSDRYTAAMKAALTKMDSAKTTNDFQAAANTFERIGDAEKTQWLPYYWAGLSLLTPGWTDQQLDKDANSARVLALCDKAEALDKNAEIYSLRNMANTQEMLVDPQNRWATYGTQASAALQAGLKLDPNNGRLYYLQAQSVFGTPPAFGGGKDKAKPLFEKSIELLKQETVKPLYPHWGLTHAQEMLAKCQ